MRLPRCKRERGTRGKHVHDENKVISRSLFSSQISHIGRQMQNDNEKKVIHTKVDKNAVCKLI